jgi:peptidoglycan/xylan/chitin deacetylase (PgdA/CDA1 family)
VIDDPILKPGYGFVNYRDLLDLMEQHNFSTSIAFIPWNWRRSASKVARLFYEHPERYSLSMHGCDHTAGEFGTRDLNTLAWKAKQATDRMARHESKTGIRHDRIIVFPQGVFSEPALSVLKHANFVAAVNTDGHWISPRLPKKQSASSGTWAICEL